MLPGATAVAFGRMTAAHPLVRAWIGAGSTGAPNYDEFADDAEITAVIEANPLSALAIEMPHKAPGMQGATFADSLPQARARLDEAQIGGAYVERENVVAAYRITAADGTVSRAVFAMVDTAEISTHAGEPGRVIRNEDVFIAKVRERVALIEATQHLLSAVLLIQTERADELDTLLAQACDDGGEPDVVDHDAAGRRHEVFVIGDEDLALRVCRLAGGGELVVADGNHRSLAAQQAGLPRFLAVITTAPALSLLPYHRLLAQWPEQLGDVATALRGIGAQVQELEGEFNTPQVSGTFHIYAPGAGYAVTLPGAGVHDGTPLEVATMDHALIEHFLIRDLLRWDPADPRISYVGGDYSAAWLKQAVDEDRAALAMAIAPVSVPDFVAVNVNRLAMPRKSTWFVPKARAGMVVARLR